MIVETLFARESRIIIIILLFDSSDRIHIKRSVACLLPCTPSHRRWKASLGELSTRFDSGYWLRSHRGRYTHQLLRVCCVFVRSLLFLVILPWRKKIYGRSLWTCSTSNILSASRPSRTLTSLFRIDWLCLYVVIFCVFYDVKFGFILSLHEDIHI